MKFPVLSHTFLSSWDNCQFKAYRMYIAKDLPRQAQTKQMRYGNEVHSAFESRLKGEGERRGEWRWPEGMKKFETIAAPLVRIGAKAEHAIGIKENGDAVGFWDDRVYLRGKVDSVAIDGVVAAVFDWKTGKRREDKAELETHAVLIKAHYPQVKRVIASYVWLQDMEVGKAHDVSHTEAKLAEIRSVANTVRNCMAVGFFPKRQNGLCGWCPVMDCEFNPKKGK